MLSIVYKIDINIFFRYDGLYSVAKVFDPEGLATTTSPIGNMEYTFFLVRLPERSDKQHIRYSNKISIAELCSKINKYRLEEGAFVLSRPIPQYDQLPPLPVVTSTSQKPVNDYVPPTIQYAEQSNSLIIRPQIVQHQQSLCSLSFTVGLSDSLPCTVYQRDLVDRGNWIYESNNEG